MKDLRFEKDEKYFMRLFILTAIVESLLILYVIVRDVIKST